jgi:FAD/FMN-containing dehydrogenase
LVDADLSGLRRSLAGVVIAAGDPGYELARRCFNALVDRRPAVIVRCLDGSDVATAFDFARLHDLEVAVRGGGHNPAGHCVCEGGLVIDLSLLRRVEVDGEGRVAHADGGATWLDFDSATQAFGLVTPGGVVGSTGVAGLTFGGGIGHLTAQRGLTCDNLVGAEVVTLTGVPCGRAPTRARSCCGGCEAAAATSGWRRDSSSACIRSSESSAVA